MNQQKLTHTILLNGLLKRIILLFSFCLFVNVVQAQIYASCTHRTILKYDTDEEDFEYQSGYDENSMFKINENITMFEHTTPTLSSTYYASSSNYDEDEQTLTMDVMSDVGNSYLYIFDINNSVIKVLYEQNEDLFMIVFTVKKFWTEE